MQIPEKSRFALFLRGLVTCLLLTCVFPLLLALFWVFVLKQYSPKFGPIGTLQVNCFIIAAGTGAVLVAYLIAFFPAVHIGRIRTTAHVIVSAVAACVAAYLSLTGSFASWVGSNVLGINDWWGDAIGVSVAAAVAFVVAALLVRGISATRKGMTEPNIGQVSSESASSAAPDEPSM